MLQFDISWKALKNLKALDFEDQRFLQWLAPRIAQGIRERTLKGVLPSGRKTDPLGFSYGKWKSKTGKKPYRDSYKSGTMWGGLNAKVTNKERFQLFFSGSHGEVVTKTQATDTKTRKKGDTVRRKVRNQDIANIWAGLGSAPRGGSVPSHAFMAADDKQERMIHRQYERRVLWKNLDKLPADSDTGKNLFVRSSVIGSTNNI